MASLKASFNVTVAELSDTMSLCYAEKTLNKLTGLMSPSIKTSANGLRS